MGKHRKPVKADTASAEKSKSNDTSAKSLNTPSKSSKNSQQRISQLSLQPRPDWHATPLSPIAFPDSLESLPTEIIENIQQYADLLLTAESKTYDAEHIQKSSDHRFMSTVMQSGTWTDKVSALTLVVQESPLHTRKQFESLLGLAGKRSRENALTALAALKDLLATGHLLPKERKLRYLNKQPGLLAGWKGVQSWKSGDVLPTGVTKQHLMYWLYEDWLKRSYFEILRLLESWSSDAIDNARSRSLDFTFELLKEKPEQEQNLLRLLVNKLGDTNKKIASKASHRLLQLQNMHPSMKGVVVSAIESEVLFKPGQGNHAKYYAAITLNQTVLRTGDPETADKLLDVYFGVFVSLLNKAKNDALKTEKVPRKSPKEAGQKRKRNVKPQAAPDDASNPDKQLEDKLVAQILAGIHRAFPYTSQENTVKLEDHIQTLFTITHSSNFGTSLRALTLLHTITSSYATVTSSTNLWDRFMRSLYESLLDPRLVIATGKHTMYFNLLFRSLKSDSHVNRVKAFVKRLLQVCVVHEPPFVVSIFYLVQELEKSFSGLKMMVSQVEPEAEESDEEEVFHDAPDPDDQRTTAKEKANEQEDTAIRPPPHKHPQIRPAYDFRKRDPSHAQADRSPLWDFLPFINHYHPSISLFASSLIPSTVARLPVKPDPASHTLVHFLDRFAYRNPKARDPSSGDTKGLRGSSLMQPALASSGTTDHFMISSGGAQDRKVPVTSEQFWQRKVEQIAPEDAFFHQYFSTIGPMRKAARDRKHMGPSAGTAQGDEDFDEEIGAGEDEIWKALSGSRPDLESEGSEEEVEEDLDESEDDEFKKEMMEGSDAELDGDEDVELNLESDDEEDVGGDGAALIDGQGDVGGADEGFDEEPSMFGAEEDEDDSSNEEDAADKPASKAAARKAKKRKLSSLPVFASVDDYEKMIDDAQRDEDDT